MTLFSPPASRLRFQSLKHVVFCYVFQSLKRVVFSYVIADFKFSTAFERMCLLRNTLISSSAFERKCALRNTLISSTNGRHPQFGPPWGGRGANQALAGLQPGGVLEPHGPSPKPGPQLEAPAPGCVGTPAPWARHESSKY